jgi:type II secretory pathway pseudopilin PulG
MTNDELTSPTLRFAFGVPSTFGIRQSTFCRKAAFTLLELLIVMTIIIILAGLTIATMSYVQTKSRRSRAEAEIAAMSAALENYKADNGVYPAASPAGATANHGLYQALTGDGNDTIGGAAKSTGVASSSGKNYMPLTNKMISPAPDSTPKPDPKTLVVSDPFGNTYNYSSPGAYNPTFDLWSTTAAPAMPTPSPSQWITNW